MSNPTRRSPISGGRLVAALIAIVFATAVLPPAAAWTLNRSRIAQTSTRAQTAIERLRSPGDVLTGLMAHTGVVCGPGRVPDREPPAGNDRGRTSYPSHIAWLREAQIAPALFGAGMPTDAWGRCFLLNARGFSTGGPVWLISAGPNGLIDTPPNALALGGDDVGGRLR
jgi:hypothetical protein